MPRSGSFDPLDRLRWRVYVLSPAGASWSRAAFTSCSSPGVTVNYQTYAEGGSHMNPRKIHNGATYKPITLRRGVIARRGVDDFAKWMGDTFSALSPEKKGVAGNQYRCDIVIEHLDRDASVVKQWILRNCVPMNYEPASDFDAADDSSLSVETLTFDYEGFEEVRSGDLITDVGDFFRRFSRGIF